MRTTQFAGLTEDAYRFIDNEATKDIEFRCPHCGKPTSYKTRRKKYSAIIGMFEEEIPLWEYELKNGEAWREIVQAEQWSSGPVIFLCLEDEMKRRHFKWLKKDIKSA